MAEPDLTPERAPLRLLRHHRRACDDRIDLSHLTGSAKAEAERRNAEQQVLSDEYDRAIHILEAWDHNGRL